MTNDPVWRYAQHSRWSNPGRYAERLRALPPDPIELADRLEGLVEHPALTDTPAHHREQDVALRTGEEMLEQLFARNGASMEEPRAGQERLLCLCRHFALLTVAVCREWRVPARVRVGFADYFTPGFREDHWVAEIWTAEAGWRLADTQLGPAQRAHFAIDFPIDQVPRDRFLVAADAWRAWRGGTIEGEALGVSHLAIRGAWFLAGSLQRDAAACAADEMLPFDYWGPANEVSEQMAIDPRSAERFDALARAMTEAPESALDAHPWALRPSEVVSYPFGERVLQALD